MVSRRTTCFDFEPPIQALQAQPAFLEDHFRHTPTADPGPTKVVDFDDPERVFASKTTPDLLRSFAILKACRLKPLVCNAETLLSVSRAMIGRRATDKAVEATFFKHFCAGEPNFYLQAFFSRYILEQYFR